MREAYGDKVRFVFRHFPLDFHAQAQKAGEAAACAGEQGKFWEMHDLLWENASKLQVADLKAHAGALGLEGAAFDAASTPAATRAWSSATSRRGRATASPAPPRSSSTGGRSSAPSPSRPSRR